MKSSSSQEEMQGVLALDALCTNQRINDVFPSTEAYAGATSISQQKSIYIEKGCPIYTSGTTILRDKRYTPMNGYYTNQIDQKKQLKWMKKLKHI